MSIAKTPEAVEVAADPALDSRVDSSGSFVHCPRSVVGTRRGTQSFCRQRTRRLSYSSRHTPLCRTPVMVHGVCLIVIGTRRCAVHLLWYKPFANNFGTPVTPYGVCLRLWHIGVPPVDPPRFHPSPPPPNQKLMSSAIPIRRRHPTFTR
jgi:hypothetical protein